MRGEYKEPQSDEKGQLHTGGNLLIQSQGGDKNPYGGNSSQESIGELVYWNNEETSKVDKAGNLNRAADELSSFPVFQDTEKEIVGKDATIVLRIEEEDVDEKQYDEGNNDPSDSVQRRKRGEEQVTRTLLKEEEDDQI